MRRLDYRYWLLVIVRLRGGLAGPETWISSALTSDAHVAVHHERLQQPLFGAVDEAERLEPQPRREQPGGHDRQRRDAKGAPAVLGRNTARASNTSVVPSTIDSDARSAAAHP